MSADAAVPPLPEEATRSAATSGPRWLGRGPARHLPEFPWDSLGAARERAGQHSDGLVDLSVGTPVDPTPQVVQAALIGASDAPGYPLTIGTVALREAAVAYAGRRLGRSGLPLTAVLPTIGSKELVVLLPLLLGLGPGDTVAHPELAYPSYHVGARLAGAAPVATDLPEDLPEPPALVWLNTPSNPTGAVLPAARMAELVSWARSVGALVVSDECYFELHDAEQPVSVLHPSVSGDGVDGVLAVHSLSKRSSAAGYRAGLVVGDPLAVAALTEVRKHAGMLVPAPVQAAAVAALDDDDHVVTVRARYAARRELLRPALAGFGFEVAPHSAGLYLWARLPGADCWAAVDRLAELGILVAPGAFYGPAGAEHVRVALTASDAGIRAAVERLTQG